ncbi:peptidase C69 [Micractinium conductrix]|uniref:Peptidase C69 n=1 Tax=Micractinium conductrix TaxID=554055 RepID=A0A2P6V131_9CHLO|nr:peptidase C69 [Micractinium conductrix]|eukprot:PSC67799.1 peptidase C69 [Micractinium conductrix]
MLIQYHKHLLVQRFGRQRAESMLRRAPRLPCVTSTLWETALATMALHSVEHPLEVAARQPQILGYNWLAQTEMANFVMLRRCLPQLSPGHSVERRRQELMKLYTEAEVDDMVCREHQVLATRPEVWHMALATMRHLGVAHPERLAFKHPRMLRVLWLTPSRLAVLLTLQRWAPGLDAA